MRRVIFGVFAADVFVVIFDEVFKDRRKEIKLLMKDFLEAEIHQLINQRFAKTIPLRTVRDVIAEFVKERDLCARACFD